MSFLLAFRTVSPGMAANRREIIDTCIAFPGGVVVSKVGVKSKPEGKAVVLCSKECASLWLEAKLA